MPPYYSHGGVTIYHGDCREIAPALAGVDALISDPPYGMDWNTDSTRFSVRGAGGRRLNGEGRSDHLTIHGDAEPFDPAPWLVYPRVVLWGANHYAQRLPVGTTLVWIKKADHLFDTFLSDAEIAWMKGGHGVYCHRKQFPPPARMAELPGAEAGRRMTAHPTQKPVSLMAWCLRMAKVPEGGLVLDPYMGSGTTLYAAKQSGFRAVGIELEERYCEMAARRCDQDVLAL